MKKLIAFFGLAIFAGGFTLFAQDLDEILESHFDVIGQKALLTHKTFVMKGNVVQGGMEFPMVLYQKRPGMMRMEAEIQGTKLIQAFDGEIGWAVMPWTGSLEPQTMGEEENKSLKQMADIDGDFYNWKEKGFDVALIGEEDMEGTPVYKIKLVKEDGDEFIYYLDAENYVILRTDAKIEVNGTEVESQSYYGNYKQVGDIIMPHSIESRVNNQVTAQIVIDSYEMDVDLEDSLFSMPETVQE